MNNNYMVSVIIPVYNVEKFLNRCVDSILSQTYKNIEIILVDDGAQDSSPQICDEYAHKDIRVKVIHKNNGGLASARNAGLKVAKGDYILFVDSDDWIKDITVEELLNIAVKNQVDFVRFIPVSAGYPDRPDGTPINFGTEDFMEDGVYNKEKMIRDIYPRLFVTPQLTMGPIVAAWRSLYNRKFLVDNNLYFDEEVKYSEDAIFSAKVVYNSNKFYYIKGGYYYNYFYNTSSITKSFKKDRWNVCKILSSTFKKEFGNKSDYDFSKQLHLEDIYNVLNALGQNTYIESFKNRYKYVKDIFNDNFTKQSMKYINLTDVNIKLKIIIYLIKYKLLLPYMVLVR